MLVYASRNVEKALSGRPELDRDASLQLATRLFPKEKLERVGDTSLLQTCPPENELYVGCFPGVSIVAAKEFGIDYPSKLPKPFLAAGSSGAIYLHAMHSVVDWLAFAKWMDGRLVRSLSLSPDSGILEDIGQRFPFEEPFWSGKHPAVDDDDEEEGYPFQFHPLELGEVALKEFFGYEIEGFGQERAPLDPETIPLMRLKRSRSRWKIW
jgi:hypothetical protein